MPKLSSKKSRRKRSSSPQKSAAKGGRAASRALSAIPVEALAAELKRRQSELPRLEARARTLRAELSAVESRIALLSGAPVAAGARGRRSEAGPARKTRTVAPRARRAAGAGPTLGERIVGFLEGRTGPASPREIAGAVAAQLGREVSQSFLVHVSITLRKLVNSGALLQPARAQYIAKNAKRDAST